MFVCRSDITAVDEDARDVGSQVQRIARRDEQVGQSVHPAIGVDHTGLRIGRHPGRAHEMARRGGIDDRLPIVALDVVSADATRFELGRERVLRRDDRLGILVVPVPVQLRLGHAEGIPFGAERDPVLAAWALFDNVEDFEPVELALGVLRPAAACQ